MRTPPATRALGATLLISAVLGTAACGGGTATTGGQSTAARTSSISSSSSSSSGSAQNAGSAVASTITHKPCSMVTLADANAAMGVTLTPDKTNVEIAGINVNCEYADTNGHQVQIVVSERPQSVDQLAAFSSHDATSIPGVGDKAYWNLSQGTLYVSSHGVGYSVGVFDDHLTLGDAKLEAAAIAMGKVANARLG